MSFTWELVSATLADYNTIQNLARFYAYDMSRYCGQSFEGWEFPANGLYECIDFKKYLDQADIHAFIIKINQELAGFAFINKLEVLPETNWNMAQFFIVAKFQRSGVGRDIAKHLFDRFQGEWSVGVIPQNTRALKFWGKVIAEYTADHFNQALMTGEQLKTIEHPNPYPNIMFRFRSPRQSSQNDLSS